MPDAVISSDNKLIISYSDKIIGNITNNTLIDDLVSTLTFNGTLTKLDLSGNVITDRNTIQGGDTFRITNGNEIVNYKILLHGDVDQNNAVNRIDASLIAKYIIDKNSGEDGALFADINLDNEVKMNDTMILLNEIG